MPARTADRRGRPRVAVLLYPGCIFFEIARATEQLAPHAEIGWFTPDGAPHAASNGATLQARGDYAALAAWAPAAVLVPGGHPDSILRPIDRAAAALQAAAAGGALLAGICAGNLVLASAGLLRGRRGTPNDGTAQAPPEVVAATRAFWDGMQVVDAELVVDSRVITAPAQAWQAYADAVATALGLPGREPAGAPITAPITASSSAPSSPPMTAPITDAEPTVEQMQARVARFDRLQPTADYVDALIPGCERTTWRVIGHPGDAPLPAAGYHLNMVRCEPGKAAPLHNHLTTEVFIVLDGAWELFWGPQGARCLRLARWDTVSIPPGVSRGFRNVGHAAAHLVGIASGDDPGRINWPDAVRAAAHAAGVELP
jgi:putative intracellular protease/amidase/quercetin dioxygenase-like cupin family protein